MAEASTMTPGVLKALNKGPVHRVCSGCGFPLPVYPGRYPTRCPHCGGGLAPKEGPPDPQDDTQIDVE